MRLFYLLFALLILVSAPSRADELLARSQIKETVQQFYSDGNFEALDHMAAQYRDLDRRTSSGLSKTTIFYGGLTQAIRAEIFQRGRLQNAIDFSEDWVKAYPQSPTAHLATAISMKYYAWTLRGGGGRHVPSDDEVLAFQNGLTNVLAYLKHRKLIASQDPYFYELYLSIMRSLGADEDEVGLVLTEAVTAYPHHYQTYFKALDYYLWISGGNPGEVETFAQKMMLHSPIGHQEAIYARIYWYAAQTRFGNGLFQSSYVHWPTMRTGIYSVLSEYSDDWNLENFSLFACLADDVEVTRDLMSRMSDRPIMPVWQTYEMLEYCRGL